MTRRSFISNLLGAMAVMALPGAVKSMTVERVNPWNPIPTHVLTQAILDDVYESLVLECGGTLI